MSAEEILARIQSYLGNGGLWNPEAMEHDKVRALIMDCRDLIQQNMRPEDGEIRHCYKCGTKMGVLKHHFKEDDIVGQMARLQGIDGALLYTCKKCLHREVVHLYRRWE